MSHQTLDNFLSNALPAKAGILDNFRTELLSACSAQSSADAYTARLRHLEPLAEGRFSRSIVEKWIEQLRQKRSQNSAKELVRLAKKFWNYGAEQGEFSGANPFLTIKLNNKNAKPHPHRITLEREREREFSSL